MATASVIQAQDSAALHKSKLSLGIGMAHDFNFKPMTITCDQIIPGLMYDAFTETYFWQPSIELLYSHYLRHKEQDAFRDYFFSFGLKARYEQNYTQYDTTCNSQALPFKIDKHEHKGVLEFPLYFNYDVNGIICRIGATPVLLSYEVEKYTKRNHSVVSNPSWRLYYGFITVRVDYLWVFSKNRQLHCFGYINRIVPNEFGFGLGLPIKYKD